MGLSPTAVGFLLPVLEMLTSSGQQWGFGKHDIHDMTYGKHIPVPLCPGAIPGPSQPTNLTEMSLLSVSRAFCWYGPSPGSNLGSNKYRQSQQEGWSPQPPQDVLCKSSWQQTQAATCLFQCLEV